MRGERILIAGLALAALWAGPSDAGDRLVGACQAAVAAQGHDVALTFPDATRVGDEIHLRFAFDNVLGHHAGGAICRFRSNAGPYPPSLVRFSVMDKSSPSMFLVAHQAAWRRLTAPVRPASAPKEADPPNAPAPAPGRRLRMPFG